MIPHFNDVLDGLILVDLLQTPHQVLQRYMGKEGLAEFCRLSSADHIYAVLFEPTCQGDQIAMGQISLPANNILIIKLTLIAYKNMI